MFCSARLTVKNEKGGSHKIKTNSSGFEKKYFSAKKLSKMPWTKIPSRAKLKGLLDKKNSNFRVIFHLVDPQGHTKL